MVYGVWYVCSVYLFSDLYHGIRYEEGLSMIECMVYGVWCIAVKHLHHLVKVRSKVVWL